MSKFKFRCPYCHLEKEVEEDIAPDCPILHGGDMRTFVMVAFERPDRRLKKSHPIQPLEDDGNSVLRFKQNNIVRYLLDHGGINLNQLACMDFSDNDWEQFAQLIGYSLSGFGELSYVSNKVYDAAAKSAKRTLARMNKEQKKRQRK